jgi:hypothetical protein
MNKPKYPPTFAANWPHVKFGTSIGRMLHLRHVNIDEQNALGSIFNSHVNIPESSSHTRHIEQTRRVVQSRISHRGDYGPERDGLALGRTQIRNLRLVVTFKQPLIQLIHTVVLG